MSEENTNEFTEADVPKSNWFKFVTVGDEVHGHLLSVHDKKSTNPDYPDQRVFEIKKDDGDIVNVGIRMDKDYLIQRTNSVDPTKFDYRIKFEFKKEIPSTKGKGYAPAKSIEIFLKKSEKTPDPNTATDDFNEFGK